MGLVAELGALDLLHLPAFGGVRTADCGYQPIEMTSLGTRFVDRILTS